MKIKILKADTHINEPPQTQKFQLCQMKCWIRSSANFFPTHTSVVQFFCRQHVLFKCMMYVCISSVAKLCPTLMWPHGLQPAKPPVHGLSQARILEWVAISSSRGSSWPRDWTHVSCVSCTAGGFFTAEPPFNQCSPNWAPVIWEEGGRTMSGKQWWLYWYKMVQVDISGNERKFENFDLYIRTSCPYFREMLITYSKPTILEVLPQGGNLWVTSSIICSLLMDCFTLHFCLNKWIWRLYHINW